MKAWSALHRSVLQLLLAEDKSKNIFGNLMIPERNKMTYLMYCKIYEWRLNEGNLT